MGENGDLVTTFRLKQPMIRRIEEWRRRYEMAHGPGVSTQFAYIYLLNAALTADGVPPDEPAVNDPEQAKR